MRFLEPLWNKLASNGHIKVRAKLPTFVSWTDYSASEPDEVTATQAVATNGAHIQTDKENDSVDNESQKPRARTRHEHPRNSKNREPDVDETRNRYETSSSVVTTPTDDNSNGPKFGRRQKSPDWQDRRGSNEAELHSQGNDPASWGLSTSVPLTTKLSTRTSRLAEVNEIVRISAEEAGSDDEARKVDGEPGRVSSQSHGIGLDGNSGQLDGVVADSMLQTNQFDGRDRSSDISGPDEREDSDGEATGEQHQAKVQFGRQAYLSSFAGFSQPNPITSKPLSDSPARKGSSVSTNNRDLSVENTSSKQDARLASKPNWISDDDNDTIESEEDEEEDGGSAIREDDEDDEDLESNGDDDNEDDSVANVDIETTDTNADAYLTDTDIHGNQRSFFQPESKGIDSLSSSSIKDIKFEMNDAKMDSEDNDEPSKTEKKWIHTSTPSSRQKRKPKRAHRGRYRPSAGSGSFSVGGNKTNMPYSGQPRIYNQYPALNEPPELEKYYSAKIRENERFLEVTPKIRVLNHVEICDVDMRPLKVSNIFQYSSLLNSSSTVFDSRSISMSKSTDSNDASDSSLPFVVTWIDRIRGEATIEAIDGHSINCEKRRNYAFQLNVVGCNGLSSNR